MAKGKEKATVSKKKDNTLLYGIGVLILIIIIVLLVRSGKQAAGPADIEVTPQQPQAPTETAPTSELPKGTMEEFACTQGAAIGFKACNLLADKNVEVVVLHQVSSTVEPLTLTGAQYYLLDENGQKVAEASQMGEVKPGDEATYTLPLSQYADTDKVEIRPIVNIDGASKICVNQRVIIIPANSCR